MDKGRNKRISRRFDIGSIEELKALARRLDCDINAIDDVSALAQPLTAGNLVMRNSLAVQPMEGVDGNADGSPGPLTVRRYERFAAGGAGLIWAEAIAVVPEGRANPKQLWINEKNKQAFTRLVEQTRAATDSIGPRHNPVLIAQLTHSGRYSRPQGTPEPIIAQRDPYRDPMVPQPEPRGGLKSAIPSDWRIVGDEYLDRLQVAYVEAASLAFEAGFDAVDIKACHGYLVNELLASRNREGKYSGSFENRARFLLEVVDGIHAELGADKEVVTRLGFYDGVPYPYGWGVDKDDWKRCDLDEPAELLNLLAQRGVRMVNFTIANPYLNPHMGRPFDTPVKEGYAEPEHPLVGVSRLIDLASRVQSQFPNIAIVGTGYSWLRHLMPNVAAAVKAAGKARIIGAGRLALAYPDFAKDILTSGRLDPGKVCIACSGCSQLMREGQPAGCVIRDSEVYSLRNNRTGEK